MRLALLLAVIVLAGCGGGSHHHAAAATPGPFADIAGTYLATVTASSGVYAGTAVGTEITVTVTGAGQVSTPTASYTLTRLGDGSFTTAVRLIGSTLSGYVDELGAAPADVSTFTLDATEHTFNGFAWVATPAGSEAFALVRLTHG